ELENPIDLRQPPTLQRVWQVMKHQRAQDSIEVQVRVRQGLDHTHVEANPCPEMGRLAARQCDHLGRRIESAHLTSSSRHRSNGESQSSRPAANVEDPLARYDARELDHPAMESRETAERQEGCPDIVESRPPDRAPLGRGSHTGGHRSLVLISLGPSPQPGEPMSRTPGLEWLDRTSRTGRPARPAGRPARSRSRSERTPDWCSWSRANSAAKSSTMCRRRASRTLIHSTLVEGLLRPLPNEHHPGAR